MTTLSRLQLPSPTKPYFHLRQAPTRYLPNQSPSVDFRRWDPSNPSPPPPPPTPSSASAAARRLSPITRYICDSLRRSHHRWGPEVLSDLDKLRRVPPDLLAEVLKTLTDPTVASKLFNWAGKQKGFKHSFASYNAFMYCLNRSNQFKSAEGVLDLMSAQGKPPSEKQFEILIRMHADAGRGLRLYYVYQKMKEFGVKPRVFLYNRVMDALVKTGHLDLALSVYGDFKGENLVEDNVTFMVIVKGLCRAGRVDEAIGVLGSMRGRGCRPDVFAYTAMVRVLVSEGNLDGCMRVWEEMRRDGVRPDVMAYTTLVLALCKENQIASAFGLFEEMKRRELLVDRAVYGALVEALVVNGDVGKGCKLLKEMMGLGYRADLGIYNCLIKGLCEGDWVDKARMLFEITVQEELVPKFNTVKPLWVSYVEKERMDEFLALVNRVRELGLPVLDYLCEFFSFLFGKGEGDLKALEVFELLKDKGYCSVSMYNVMIEGLHKVGEVKRALLLFKEMRETSDFEPDSSTYSYVIPCMVDDGDVKEACSCHNKMIEMSWIPSIAAYRSLVTGLCKLGQIRQALMLVQDCLGNVIDGPMEFKYSLTVLHACQSRKAEKVIEVLNEMVQQGYPLDDVVYCAVIHGFCKCDNLDGAKEVFLAMRRQNILTETNLILYEDLLVEHSNMLSVELARAGLKLFSRRSKTRSKLTRVLGILS
ncbi:Pentatricopeptide repeat-containing protein [Acorus calamus]|uniref:Pentatricopeptide repeat-containing protein n=1 Tax=Acorus calamus TaxID=4465 RepID=A0AAV9F0X6_ACOCL|nr:Pentatricopeptide repeat-containing protein [Acorus calamus]